MNMDYMNSDVYTEDQKWEISQGLQMGLDVGQYANPKFLAIQMRQIRVGMLEQLPVEWYAKPEYDWFQMEEIRKGLQAGIRVQAYTNPDIPFEKMRQIRKGLEAGIDLTALLDLPAGILREIRKAKKAGVDIIPYVKAGYDDDQLRQIRHAIAKKLPIDDYLQPEFRGVSIREICYGLEHHVDVSLYAKTEYNWHQMREIRIGLEKRLDVSLYRNSLYSWQQMKEVRLGLEDGLDVTRYSSLMYTAHAMHALRMELIASGRIQPDAGAVVANRYADFTLQVNENGMKAEAFLTDRSKPVQESVLLAALQDHGIVRGIDYVAVKQLCDGNAPEDTVQIAQGKLPERGDDGWYEFFFDKDVKSNPIRLEDGSVDYQNAKWFELVQKGDLLVEYHPATMGTDGFTIRGDVIPAQKGKEKLLLSGSGFDLSEDRCRYTASVDGKVEYTDGRLDVTAVLVMQDVTLATGNINFNGSVYVRGDIGDDVHIKADKDILVDGFISAVELEAGGDIILRQGNNAAGRGQIRAGGSVRGKFFEQANVVAGKDIYANYCMNSMLDAGGAIEISGRNGNIVGGVARAAGSIQAIDIGNAAGTKTKLVLGRRKGIGDLEIVLGANMHKVGEELQLLQNAYQEMRRKYPPEQRNLNPVFIKVENALYTKQRQLKKLQAQKEAIEAQKKEANAARVVASGTIYDGVAVEINGVSWNAGKASDVILQKKGNYIGMYRNH